LGNPGPKYAANRHNIGFMALDRIAADHGFPPWRKAFQGMVSEARLGSEKVALLKPETFMNLSGQSVQAAVAFWKLPLADLTVFHDELDLAPGKMRLKQGGGHAGHNGLRSIHAHLGDDYARVRLRPARLCQGRSGLAGRPSARRLRRRRGAGRGRRTEVHERRQPAHRAAPVVDHQGQARTCPRTRPLGRRYPQPDAKASGQVSVSTVRQAFRDQARACDALGSPLMARLIAGLAERLAPGDPVSDHVLGWPGDPSSAADSLPLRLAGGLHALVLSGADPDLAAAYATPGADPTPAALAAILRHPDHLLDWLKSPPQTNEVRRSAVLIATAHWLTAHYRLPLILSELGASAGLNLLWDHYALTDGQQSLGPPAPALTLTPDWTGPHPPASAPQVIDRRGVDLNPLDPVADRLRLLAYLWADQPDRIARTRAALDLAATLHPQIDRGDAADWLETRLQTRHPGALHLIFHTVAWQYFPPATQTRALAALDRAGATATTNAPLARLAMEADGQTPGAALTLTLWPGNQTISLGRADFHGRWLHWTAP
jgi:hypothetical protein